MPRLSAPPLPFFRVCGSCGHPGSPSGASHSERARDRQERAAPCPRCLPAAAGWVVVLLGTTSVDFGSAPPAFYGRCKPCGPHHGEQEVRAPVSLPRLVRNTAATINVFSYCSDDEKLHF